MVTKGIKLIHEEEITSAVSSVTVDNVFTDNYQFYKVYFSGLKGSDSTGDTVKFQFLVSNSADTNSEYDRDNIYTNYKWSWWNGWIIQPKPFLYFKFKQWNWCNKFSFVNYCKHTKH